jgi:hypothetical protein
MSEPAIKGVVLTNLVEDVQALCDSGRIAPEELEARLDEDDRALLESKPGSTDWVPIDRYRRLSELLWDVVGNRSPTYLERRGRASAELVLAAGLYRQVEFLQERYDTSDLRAARASLELVVTLQGSLINFGEWKVEDDADHGDRLQIVIDRAEAFPDVLCHSMVGFLNRLAETRSNASKWYFERPSRDVLRFRMRLAAA